MADVRAARTEEKIGHSGRDDSTKKRETQEHSQEWLATRRPPQKAAATGAGRQDAGATRCYLPALRRSLGVASQISSPLGGTRRFSSIRATPDFFRAVR
jgi:hypothetical protein